MTRCEKSSQTVVASAGSGAGLATARTKGNRLGETVEKLRSLVRSRGILFPTWERGVRQFTPYDGLREVADVGAATLPTKVGATMRHVPIRYNPE